MTENGNSTKRRYYNTPGVVDGNLARELNTDELRHRLETSGQLDFDQQYRKRKESQAELIARQREIAPIETTGQLVDIIRSAMPAAALREKQHPAKRSFQAIRIAVNSELDELPPMLQSAADGLKPGGRLAVITFHSLEDRIVKQTMKELATGCTCPPSFPVCVCGKKPKMKLVSRKPIISGSEELEYNPRARSAKLRVAERTEF